MPRTFRRSLVVGQQGFSLLEMLMVVAIMGTLGAMVALIAPNMIRGAKADSAVSQGLEVIRTARETAISKRRNVRIIFTGTKTIEVWQENICAPIPCSDAAAIAYAATPAGTTKLRTVELEDRMEFLRPVVTDTPDKFATGPPSQAGAIAFSGWATPKFTSEGTLIDQTGDPLNATLFLAIPNQPNSGRAITIFGTTGLMRIWRWDGGKWVE